MEQATLDGNKMISHTYRNTGITESEYAAIHQWLKKNYGKADKCSNPDCNSISPKKFEWALIRGAKYEKNVSNFTMLCVPCHRKYDFTEEARKKRSDYMKNRIISEATIIKMSKAQSGRIITEKTREKMGNSRRGGKSPCAKKVVCNKSGIVFGSLADAAKAVKIKKTTLSAMLTGQNKNKTTLVYEQQ